jgi:predicted MFS family arabinose efflux permease
MVLTKTRTPTIGWLAVLSVMLGIFSLVTTEILPIGLLTRIGGEYRISDGTAGWTMTVPGIVAALAAPAVTVATGRFDRRRLLCALMGVLACADFLAAVAPSYWLLLVARVLVGLAIGAFWSIGAGLAARLVPERSAGRATAVIFAAVPLGSVLGVPLGTLVGDFAGWRMSFAALGFLTVGVLVALAVFLPPLPPAKVTRLAVLRKMLQDNTIRLGLLATFLIVLGHFGAYTYVTPFLQQVTQVGPGLLSTFLLVYGAAGIVGNFVAGWTVSRSPRTTFLVAGSLLAVSTLLLPAFGTGKVGAVVLLVGWGLAYGAVPVCSMAWLARSAPQAPEAATVLFTSSFQATISVGAVLGGVVVDAGSPSLVMLCGGTAAALMVMVVARSSAA